MIRTDTLTPEEVERLPSETRFLYRQAEKLKGRLLAEGQPGYGAIGVGCDWLISHITRAARMEALVQEVEKTTCFCDDWMNNPAGEKCWFCRAKAVLALVPTERSK